MVAPSALLLALHLVFRARGSLRDLVVLEEDDVPLIPFFPVLIRCPLAVFGKLAPSCHRRRANWLTTGSFCTKLLQPSTSAGTVDRSRLRRFAPLAFTKNSPPWDRTPSHPPTTYRTIARGE